MQLKLLLSHLEDWKMNNLRVYSLPANMPRTLTRSSPASFSQENTSQGPKSLKDLGSFPLMTQMASVLVRAF